jgi:BirA family biotin operon repressor/biotin-[acetyl-CoA-carboxylase] ligase
VVSTRNQTCGKGRRGTAWHTEPGDICLTLCFIKQNLEDSLLGMVASLSLQEVLFLYGIKTLCKWPNDLITADAYKKLSGNMAQPITINKQPGIALGIGINLISKRKLRLAFVQQHNISASPIPPVGLADLMRIPPTYLEIRNCFIVRFLSNLKILKHTGVSPFIKSINNNLAFVNQPVQMIAHNQKWQGLLCGISKIGELILKVGKTQYKHFATGDVSLLRKDRFRSLS